MLTKTPVGRPTTEKITYSYDSGGIGSYQLGRLTKLVDGTGTTSFQYDHRGNLLVKRQKVGTTTTANLTTPAGLRSITYDARRNPPCQPERDACFLKRRD
jgi:YD repeat-containing protein